MAGDDGLSISGGAGGVAASYADMLSYSRVIDGAGDGLWTASRHLGGVLVSADLAQAVVLCPVEVGEAEAAIGAAATGPHGALLVSGELEVTARLVRWSVDLYQVTDEALAGLAELGYDAAGFTLGTTLPGLALGGFLLYESNPELARLLAPGLAADLQQQLYDHPWLQEALTRMAPGTVQGGAFTLSALLPAGPALLVALSGGNWPSGDYRSSIAGLLAVAGHFGALQDTGTFHPVKDGPAHPVDLAAGTFLQNVYLEQRALSQVDADVQVVTVRHADGSTGYIVQIPGTQDWGTTRGDNPVDLTTNVQLEAMAGPTKMQDAVVEAMQRAGIPPGAPVMLTGHSQGGITAMALATDPRVRDRFDIRSVVTAGSPVGRFRPPDGVSVMSLENDQDLVPRLDGADNPDQPNWVTVHRDLTVGGAPLVEHTAGAAHDQTNYAQTGHEIDASTSAGIAAWRRENVAFMNGVASAQHYHLTPAGG